MQNSNFKKGENIYMKINEKIMNLRKKAGLSQEELAEKLNVTRQTVSKWELGTINPKMDKISEMSKIFNVTLEELTNEEEILEEKASSNTDTEKDKTTKDTNVRKWPIILIGVLLIALVMVLIYRIIIMGSIFGIGKKIINKGSDIINDISSSMNNTNKDYQKAYEENQNKAMELYKSMSAQMDEEYNASVEKSEKEHEEFEKEFNKQKKEVEEQKKKALEIEESVKKMMK